VTSTGTQLRQELAAEMAERGMVARMVLLDRHRFGEVDLCQWPDDVCNAGRHMGTHFCEAHVGPMRERACEEIRESYGICYSEPDDERSAA
jgi:hypothetical protein